MGHTPKLNIYYPDSTEPRQIPGDFDEMYPTVDPLVAYEGMNGMLPLPGGGYGTLSPPYPGMVIEYANSNPDPTYAWNWKLVFDPASTGGDNLHPWRYIGGAPTEVEGETSLAPFISNSANPALASGWKIDPALQFPIPWEGLWDVEAQVTLVNPGNSAFAYIVGGFGPSAPPDLQPLKWRGDVTYQTCSFRKRYSLDDGLHAMYWYTNAQTGGGNDVNVQYRTMRIWPVAIGDHSYPAT